MVIFLRGSIAFFLASSMVLSLGACSKKVEDKPKTAAQPEAEKQAEKAAVDKSVRDNPVYGNQIKALDKAKEVQKTVEAQAEEQAKKIDDATK